MKLERSDIKHPLWRKKVDASLLKMQQRQFQNGFGMFGALRNSLLMQRVVMARETHKILVISQWQHDDIIKYIFMALLVKADIDLNELEDADDNQLRKSVNSLVSLLQEYANGGLEFIYNQEKDEPYLFEDETCFVRLLKECSLDLKDDI